MDYSALFIDPTSQRVGVGTFIPQKQFHIQGDMMLTGSIYDSTGEPFSLAGGAQWRSPSSTPTLIGPSGVTFAITSNVALQRYSANDLTWNIQTIFVVSQNTANAATADYTLRLPVAMNAGAYAYASSVGELWLTATNGTITSSYKAIAKTIVGNKDTIILRYLNGTTDASLVNIGAGFTLTLGGHIMYSTEVFVRNPPVDSIFIPTTSVQWTSTTYPHPALVGPSGSTVTITSNVGALRYIGDDLINNIYVQATLGAQPTNVSSPYTISLQYPLMTSFYSGAAIVGDLWLTVINSSVSTMYKGLARVYDTSNVAISYLNGTYELGLGTIDTGSTIHLQGNITYKTSTLATIAIPAEYVPNNFTQDISGNVAINNGGVPTRAQLDIIHYSNLPALVVDQRGSHENIVELRKNAALKLKIDGNGNITTSGTISASNLSVLGDRVILNTITSNTEQMVIENAGTGPALKVTQTGANSIAEFYDDGNVLALKIADGGNVGIGTGIPMAQLHVNGTGAMILPSGTTAQIPSIAVLGMLRYNTDLNKLQYYNTFGWRSLGGVVATGGNNIIDVGGYRVHIFTSSGNFTLESGGELEYLIVAGGGGGGGSYHGGGGGAGGYRCSVRQEYSGGGAVAETPVTFSARTYSIIVGAGGTGGPGGHAADARGSTGFNSSLDTIIALGGGGAGAGGSTSVGTFNPGKGGGSGGGGGRYSNTLGAGGVGEPGQGYAGGSTIGTPGAYYPCAGGGGAGGLGGNTVATGGASGGTGVQSSITGTPTYRAGGGGGSIYNTTDNALFGQGGLGGGGTGTNTRGTNGTNNTGSGGGGSERSYPSEIAHREGGNGGSGIVIIRYLL